MREFLLGLVVLVGLVLSPIMGVQVQAQQPSRASMILTLNDQTEYLETIYGMPNTANMTTLIAKYGQAMNAYSGQSYPDPAVGVTLAAYQTIIEAHQFEMADFLAAKSDFFCELAALLYWVENEYDQNSPSSFADYLQLLVPIGEKFDAMAALLISIGTKDAAIDFGPLRAVFVTLGLTW